MGSRLNTFYYFLDIGANGNKIDIILVFIDIIAEYLLTLFIDHIYIINNEQFLFTENSAT
jgi:hypothetical protein